jgi:hypothetical protein
MRASRDVSAHNRQTTIMHKSHSLCHRSLTACLPCSQAPPSTAQPALPRKRCRGHSGGSDRHRLAARGSAAGRRDGGVRSRCRRIVRCRPDRTDGHPDVRTGRVRHQLRRAVQQPSFTCAASTRACPPASSATSTKSRSAPRPSTPTPRRWTAPCSTLPPSTSSAARKAPCTAPAPWADC